ncbi:unnamed protein product, partial [Ascophyllum nodosum]
VQDDLLKSVALIQRELDRVGASSYATKELIAETRASAAYSTATPSSGADAASFLESMAQQADDHVDVCCQ